MSVFKYNSLIFYQILIIVSIVDNCDFLGAITGDNSAGGEVYPKKKATPKAAFFFGD